jgi:CelD/BcsL family acetyltransferase involved in cellulose biosynthesis
MLKIEIINPLEISDWNDHIAQLPGASIFHTANWARVLAESYNYQPAYFTAFNDGQIAGCIPMMDVKSIVTGRRGVSLPFTDACQPLAENGATFDAMWRSVLNYARKNSWKYIELRGPHAGYQSQPASVSFLTHVLAFDGSEEEVFNQFRDSTKRNIKKAVKAGVVVQRSHSLESIRAFYKLNCITRKKHGLPPQPLKFFERIHESVISKKMGFVQLAHHDRVVIAGAIFFHFNNSLIYKYGASNPSYLNIRPNNLVIWAAIQWGLQNGFHRFDFGRTEADHAGLLQFKRGWGAQETQLPYYRYRLVAQRFFPQASNVKTSFMVFQKMPMCLLKLTGKVLYRHVG